MTHKQATFFDLMAVVRRGSLQLTELPELATKAILFYSFYQNIGIITGYRFPIDSLSSAGSMFVFASFLSFDLNTQLKSLTPLFVAGNVLLLIYIFTQIILLAFQASEIKMRAKKPFFDPSWLFRSGFLDSVIQIYLWVFFLPMWELAFAPLVCRIWPEENIIHPLSSLEISYFNLAYKNPSIFWLGIGSLSVQVVWVVLLIGWLLPRNSIPDNHLVSESRTFDLLVLAHKLPLAIRTLLIYVLPKEGRIAMSLIRIFFLSLQLKISLSRLTFTRVTTLRFFIRGVLFNLGFELVQFIIVFGSWAGLPMSMIGFEQTAITTSAFFLASWALEKYLFWKRLESIIQAPPDKLTSLDLFRYFTLYRFAKENSFRRFVYNGRDTLDDVTRYHNIVFSHYTDCRESADCICSFLKAGDSFWDKQASCALFIRPNDPTGFENLKTICSLGFVKLFIKSLLDDALQRGLLEPSLILQYVRHLLFEEADFFNASFLLNHIRLHGVVPCNHTDLLFLDIAFRREIKFHSDHKVVRSNFPNAEKLLAVLEKSEILQDKIVDAGECLVSVLRAISDRKLTDQLRFHLIWESLAAFEKSMKAIQEEFTSLPQNLRLYNLCREFVRSFCQDFYADNVFKRWILEPIHRFNRDSR